MQFTSLPFHLTTKSKGSSTMLCTVVAGLTLESLSLPHYKKVLKLFRFPGSYHLRNPIAVLTQVLHFNEFSQNERKEPDPCLKSKKQQVHGDSPLEAQKETMEPLTLQVSQP